jgi:DNA-directed RNA polymerase subunit E'/Rpb7
MGDPLFERRALVRNVHVDSKYLQRNIEASLLAQLRHKYEGVCVAEGYIHDRSIAVLEHSLGRTNLIKGGLEYTVKFQADVCMPHPGQTFRVPVTLKSKIGIHAEMTPLKVLLPRDLHIGSPDFETAKEGEEIEFEVVGARFQQGDDSIVVLGQMKGIIQPAKEAPSADGSSSAAAEPVIAAAVGSAPKGDSAVRQVVVEASAAKPAEQGPRRRKIRLNPSSLPNESGSKGAPEGNA